MSVKLVGVILDLKLTFNTHVNEICKKEGQKLNALARIIPQLDFDQKNVCWMHIFFFFPFIFPFQFALAENLLMKNYLKKYKT